MRFALLIALFAALATPGRGFSQSNQPAPTLEEIKADFAAGKYQDVVRKSTRALSVRSESERPGSHSLAAATPGKSQDRAAIEALKGDAHLHLKQNQQAVEAFTAAAKDSQDASDIGLYRATALLIKRSRAQVYVPRTPSADTKDKPQPIDIIEPASRKKAFAALYNDEAKTVAAKAASARGKQNLKQILDVLDDVLDLRAVELAGTGSDEGTKKMVADVAGGAGKLLGDAVKTMSINVEKIAELANQTTEKRKNNTYGPNENIVTKRGLTSSEKNTLGDVIVTCKEVEAATGQIAEALGGDSAAASIDGVKSSASALATRAEEVLKADYSRTRVPIDTTPIRGGSTGSGNTPNQPPPGH